MEQTVKLCTKCKKNPKAGDESDTNPWCQPCRTEYTKNRNATQEWRYERRGIIRGMRAIKEYLEEYFRGQGRAIMGPEVASIIEALPGPAVAAEDAKPD